MARVTGKYDVDFERGEGGLKSVFGTFIGTRLKEGEKQYLRELKAADPTNEYKILKNLMDERQKLIGDMGGLQASTSGGGTVSVSSTDPGGKYMADYMENLEQRNEDRGREFDSGFNSAGVFSEDLEGALETDWSSKEKRTRVAQLFAENMEKSIRGKDINAGIAAGMSSIVRNAVKAKTLDENTANEILSDLQNSAGVSAEDMKAFANPTYMTPGQSARLPLYLQGSKRTTTARKLMGDGIPATELAGFYTRRLRELDALIAEQEKTYRQASEEYKQLAKGPGRNLALAPLSSRPSALSESMDRYAELVDLDPDYAKAIADKSSEERRFTIPDRYEGLTSVAGSGGKPPIDVLLESTDSLAVLRGKKYDAPAPGEFGIKSSPPRDLDSDDVDLVRGNLERMLQTVNSPMFAGQKYGKIESGGQKMEIGEYLSEAMSFLDEVEPEMRPQLAQEFSDELIDWQQSQSKDVIKTARAEGQPGYAVSRSIGNIRKAKKDYDSTGDLKAFQDVIVKEHSVMNSTDSEILGDVGNAALSQIDNFTRNGDIDYLDKALVNLKSVAEKLAVEGSGVLL